MRLTSQWRFIFQTLPLLTAIGFHPFSSAAAPLTITTTSLPTATQFVPYPQTNITVQGGTPPYVFSITSGELSPGLFLSSSGSITGTPYAAIHAGDFTVTVTDQSVPVQTASKMFSISIDASRAPELMSTNPNSAQAGTGPLTLNLMATSFDKTSTLSWSFNGQTSALPLQVTLLPNFVSTGQATCQVPANLLTQPGTAMITLTDSHGTSLPVSFAITSAPSPGAGGIITTIAGRDFSFPTLPLPAKTAPLGAVSRIATDSAGNFYVTDVDNHLVIKVDSTGTASIVAGNGIPGFSGDGGAATNASLTFPQGIVVDAGGNIFFSDGDRVRKVIRNGSNSVITTVAGNGGSDPYQDNIPALNASILPRDLAIDPAGNLYIADVLNGRIRRLSPNGILTTVAGNGNTGDQLGSAGGDGGPATATGMEIASIAYSSGLLYLSDYFRIRTVDSNGIIRTIAGGTSGSDSGDGGPATQAVINADQGITVDSRGNVYISESQNEVVRKISSTGTITRVAGNGSQGASGDGIAATQSSLNSPAAVAVDASGNLLIADSGNRRVRSVNLSSQIATVAGTGSPRFAGDGSAATLALLDQPAGLAIDASGDLFVADLNNNRIRKIDPSGVITTVAGNGTFGSTPDGGPATSAALGLGYIDGDIDGNVGVAVDSGGNIYFAEPYNNKIRKVAPGGTLQTVAGNGACDFSGDGGPATGAALCDIAGLAIDSTGNLFVADASNGRIRKISPSGQISTIAGNGGLFFSGSGHSALQTSLGYITAVAADSLGNLFVNAGNGIERLGPDGVLAQFAGNQIQTYSGDWLSAPLAGVSASSLNSGPGGVYFADAYDLRVRQVDTSGIVRPVAGNGSAGNGGDGGPATAANLGSNGMAGGGPYAIAADSQGNIYIADTFNNRIREVLAAPPYFPDPTLASGPIILSSTAQGAPVSANLAILVDKQTGSTVQVPGMTFTASVTQGSSWLSISQTAGNTPGLITIKANPFALNVTPPVNGLVSVSGSITITIPNASPSTRVIPIVLQVRPALPAKLQIDNSSLSYVYSTTSAPRSQNVNVSNAGGGSMPFTISMSFDSPTIKPWLTITPSSGTAIPDNPVLVAVQATPANLPAGTYAAHILIMAPGAGLVTVPVSMIISANPLILLLSKPELVFTAVQNGGAIPSQTFGVLNIGSGPLSWTIPPPTTLRGGNWLSAAGVTPSSGTTTANNPGSAPLVTVTVNSSGLTSGVYYGLIKVLSPGPPPAVNTPQYVVVVLDVLPPSTLVVPIVQPASLVFTGAVAQEPPGSQNLQIYDTSGTMKTFLASVSTDDGGNWIQILPSDGTIPRTQPSALVVQPLTGSLAAGVHTANIVLRFSDGNTNRIPITVIVTGTAPTTTPGLTGASTTRHTTPATTGCAPATLTPYLTSLGDNFNVKAGYVRGLDALVVDNCGNPLSDPQASVGVSFNNGDMPQNLVLVTPGVWHGYWNAVTPKNNMTITVRAQSGTVGGKADFLGDLGTGQGNPLVLPNGIVSAADYAASDTAPGALISIFGSNLASGTLQAPQLPLITDLGDSTITLKDFVLPIYLVSPGQLNAVVPYAMPLGPNQQLFVQNSDTSYSSPVHINVAAAQPGVFLWDLLKDGNLADFYATVTDLRGNLIQPSNPAHRGDIVVIYGAGLGAVNPAVSDGAAITSQARTVNPVTVSFGGVAADSNDPIFYAGVAVGPGVYQINVRIPATAPLGDRISLTITVTDTNNRPIVSTAALTTIH